MNAPLVQMKNINKKFQGVSALKDVSLEIAPNEIMCLLGENGAGKSTLIKILSGSILPDSGEILFNNKLVNIKSPRIATETGISVVHQELDLVLLGIRFLLVPFFNFSINKRCVLSMFSYCKKVDLNFVGLPDKNSSKIQ